MKGSGVYHSLYVKFPFRVLYYLLSLFTFSIFFFYHNKLRSRLNAKDYIMHNLSRIIFTNTPTKCFLYKFFFFLQASLYSQMLRRKLSHQTQTIPMAYTIFITPPSQVPHSHSSQPCLVECPSHNSHNPT